MSPAREFAVNITVALTFVSGSVQPDQSRVTQKITKSHLRLRSVMDGHIRLCLLRRVGVVVGLVLSVISAWCDSGDTLTSYAREFKRVLESQILPYWLSTGQDLQYGGYILADDGRGNRHAIEKHLVSQTRMLWTFSHVWLNGYTDTNRSSLEAATQGFRFLQKHFRDPVYGGYYWKTDLAGRVTDDRKILYGQAFTIYALVEYYRASGESEPLQAAMELYRLIQRYAHDDKHGGWIEHFERDWKPILDPAVVVEVEVAGCKSANTHLHLMEAFAELGAVTQDADVIRSVAEVLQVNKRYFYPVNPTQSCPIRQLDWRVVQKSSEQELSYGHNVEFVWLMLRAEDVLGRTRSWDHFEGYIRYALKYGADNEFGGLFYRGPAVGYATVRDKVWWVQAEWLAALTEAVRCKPEPAYVNALEKTAAFVFSRQADRDGIWFDTVSCDGQPKDMRKAHNWKANYHDVRAMVKFINVFLPSRTLATQQSVGYNNRVVP